MSANDRMFALKLGRALMPWLKKALSRFKWSRKFQK
jgi:hypothetical protein